MAGSNQATAQASNKKRDSKGKKLSIFGRLRNIFHYKIRLNAIFRGKKDTGEDSVDETSKPPKEKKQKIKKEPKPKKTKQPKEPKEPKEKKGGAIGAPVLVVVIVCALLGVSGIAYGAMALYGESNSIVSLMEKGFGHMANESYSDATKTFQKVLDQDDMFISAYLYMADSYIAMEDPEQAVEILQLGYDTTENELIRERLDLMLSPNEDEEGNRELPIRWADPAFEQMIRKALDIPNSQDIYASELARVRSIKIVGGTHIAITQTSTPDNPVSSYQKMVGDTYVALNENFNSLNTTSGYQIDGVLYTESGNIQTLDDVAHFENLRKLTVTYNRVSDISGVSKLQSLDTLSLYCNEISDISPLRSLKELKYLYIYNNRISDISPLSSMSNLQSLYAQNNEVEDISPLHSLQKLRELFISGNRVSDITPLSSLSSLTFLYADNNNVSDISTITEISSLTDVSFVDNPVEDYSPADGIQNVNKAFAPITLNTNAEEA